MDDWLKALEDLEAYDRRKEARKKLTPKPVRVLEATPPPLDATPLPIDIEKEGAARVPRDTSDSSDENACCARPADVTPAPVRERRMSRYEELCHRPSITMKNDDLEVMDQLSEIICSVNTALHKLQQFNRDFKGVLPAKRAANWEDNLKDTASIMMHEFHALRNGKQKKTYDKRQICQKCHSVFMVALPDGICDECRSLEGSTSGEY